MRWKCAGEEVSSVDNDIRRPDLPFVCFANQSLIMFSLTSLRSSLVSPKSFVIAHNLFILSCSLNISPLSSLLLPIKVLYRSVT